MLLLLLPLLQSSSLKETSCLSCKPEHTALLAAHSVFLLHSFSFSIQAECVCVASFCSPVLVLDESRLARRSASGDCVTLLVWNNQRRLCSVMSVTPSGDGGMQNRARESSSLKHISPPGSLDSGFLLVPPVSTCGSEARALSSSALLLGHH